ncbi:unnamed protein product [Phytophthora fragariaefolia]|uniref:Unnamed protein product n=1 Tax=Phytophthora fragariaefolia TaxID=1490495 RepID=A0A9W6XB98_9STRA|nr:unnamed protein product [Phytophthora fragariaefolia]
MERGHDNFEYSPEFALCLSRHSCRTRPSRSPTAPTGRAPPPAALPIKPGWERRQQAAGQATSGAAAIDALKGRGAEPCASGRRATRRPYEGRLLQRRSLACIAVPFAGKNSTSFVSSLNTAISADRARQRARVSLSTPAECPEQHRLLLVVQGVGKDTVGMRDSSGNMLDKLAAIWNTSTTHLSQARPAASAASVTSRDGGHRLGSGAVRLDPRADDARSPREVEDDEADGEDWWLK